MGINGIDIKKIEKDFDVKVNKELNWNFTLKIDDLHEFNIIGLDEKGRELFYKPGVLLVVETRTMG